MALPYFTFFARVLDICDAQLSIISVSLAALPLTMPKKYELISLTSESSPNLSFNVFTNDSAYTKKLCRSCCWKMLDISLSVEDIIFSRV